MKSSANIKLAGILFSGALLSLILAILINLATLGRPDKHLLEGTAQLARYTIDCIQPETSPLFNGQVAFLDNRYQLNAALFDTQGAMIASYWQGSHPPKEIKDISAQIKSFEEQAYVSLHSWVMEENICQKGWTLVLNDPYNQLFRNLLFRRQAILFILTSGCLIGMIMFFWIYLSKKGIEASKILKAFGQGRWQSRLKISHWESSFTLLHEFNNMAEKISQLVGKIEQLESTRSQMLAELAHDTRTPISGLISSFDTLREFGDTLDEAKKTEILDHIHEDLIYFTRLVDDLFFLAHIDSRIQNSFESYVNLDELAASCWRSTFQKTSHLRLSYSCEILPQILGDNVLLKRMILNFLENAKRYAHSYVTCNFALKPNNVVITIENDGNLLSSEQLENWGHKQKRRTIHENSGNPHISLGLGSSIACRVAAAHGGKATITQAHCDKLACITVSVVLPHNLL